jgi:hypothetical protein
VLEILAHESESPDRITMYLGIVPVVRGIVPVVRGIDWIAYALVYHLDTSACFLL